MSCVEKRPQLSIQNPNKGRKKKAKRLRREGDQVKFSDRRFERWQVVGFRKARRKQEEGQTIHKLHVLGMIDDL